MALSIFIYCYSFFSYVPTYSYNYNSINIDIYCYFSYIAIYNYICIYCSKASLLGRRRVSSICVVVVVVSYVLVTLV
jgi:hypothetical protein